ncbi:1-acylglycerol-3-phosphate O-acyltransferase [Gallaecimonas pentaromativorans]|uniref:1-acyl-sn-glycerol-3-phosphate acyltransferase n=1 Tax=Gallaecimonas pentaromativorans TaxID=584787 RepID=A0A3N1PJF2_9GAMM|nr:1-acylglycerol-3-phosphate O-acyltransferase [Gallaecimonas pentaromativorans]ROQ28733.1 1-acyl-sn-glycerol-3-phosphate acyltransferase [Gallaecimonas pentaromativorans]
MLALLRLLLLAVFFLLVCVLGSLFCLLRPFHANHVYRFSHLFASFAPMLGIKIKVEGSEHLPKGNAVFIGNHQSTWDLFTASKAVRPGTVTVGKKSLVWIPFFGPLYWLTGNILIDRKNSSKAKGTIDQTAKRIREEHLSVWLFPEGTRSYGRGLLPFKTGAFHTAIAAGVPIVPIAVSSLDNIRLNKWNNGEVVVRYLPVIETQNLNKSDARELTERCYQLMSQTLGELNGAVAQKGSE